MALLTSTTCCSSTIYLRHRPPTPQVRKHTSATSTGLQYPDHAALEKSTQGPDPNQLMDTFVASPKSDEQHIVGSKPGPYVAEKSYNLYTRLGARIAMVGIDARTERTRHQVNYPETYDLIFNRVRSELGAAASSGQPIKHLIVLLGIPIAYPVSHTSMCC